VYNIYSRGQREGVTCERRVEGWEQANAPKRVGRGDGHGFMPAVCSVARAVCKSSAGGLHILQSSQWHNYAIPSIAQLVIRIATQFLNWGETQGGSTRVRLSCQSEHCLIGGMNKLLTLKSRCRPPQSLTPAPPNLTASRLQDTLFSLRSTYRDHEVEHEGAEMKSKW